MPETKTGSTYTVAQLKQAAYNAGFRGNNLAIAVAVSLAENPARNPRAVNINGNRTIDRGAWQINSIHGFGGNPYDLQTNANQAYAVYQKQGWSAWTVYKNKTYAKNLPTAASGGGVFSGATGGGTIDTNNGSLLGDVVTGAIPGLEAAKLLGVGQDGFWNRFNSLLDHVTDPGFWKRAGIIVLALLLVIIGLVIMLGSNKTVRQGAELAATKGMVSEG